MSQREDTVRSIEAKPLLADVIVRNIANLSRLRLQMLDAVQDKLGIVNDTHSELAQLEIETKPEDVLAEIPRLRDYVLQQQAGARQGGSRP